MNDFDRALKSLQRVQEWAGIAWVCVLKEHWRGAPKVRRPEGVQGWTGSCMAGARSMWPIMCRFWPAITGGLEVKADNATLAATVCISWNNPSERELRETCQRAYLDGRRPNILQAIAWVKNDLKSRGFYAVDAVIKTMLQEDEFAKLRNPVGRPARQQRR